MKNEVFDFFKDLFSKNGFNLYMVGSSSRDFLLKKEIEDFDFVTEATYEEIIKFLKVDDAFKKYGTYKIKYLNKNVDIVTLREEGPYLDHRHPSYIKFSKDINKDYSRRDFTINAIYIDKNYNILDVSKQGKLDLDNKILRFIGDPLTRINEDPLRILRAKRFIVEYDLKVDENTRKILKDNQGLLKYINQDKINEERRKYLKISGGKDYEF